MNVGTHSTVIGVFESQTRAQAAVNDLRRLGFAESQIGVAAKHDANVNRGVDGADVGDAEDDSASGAMTGAAVGVGAGALWGLGILAGVLPAIGPVIAGGTLAALAASAATGAAAGGLGGALIGLGLSQEDVKYYDGEFNRGRVIVTVDAGDRALEVGRVFSENGGVTRNPGA